MWDFEEEVARSAAACSTFSSTLTSHDGLAYRWCFMMMMTMWYHEDYDGDHNTIMSSSRNTLWGRRDTNRVQIWKCSLPTYLLTRIGSWDAIASKKAVNLKLSVFRFFRFSGRVVTLQIFPLCHICHVFPVHLTFFQSAVNLQVAQIFGIVIFHVYGGCRLAHRGNLFLIFLLYQFHTCLSVSTTHGGEGGSQLPILGQNCFCNINLFISLIV